MSFSLVKAKGHQLGHKCKSLIICVIHCSYTAEVFGIEHLLFVSGQVPVWK